MTLKAIIFDVDGTLAETEEQGHRPAFNHAFEEAGLRWFWDEATYARLLAVTGGKERIAAWCREADPKVLARPDFAAWAAQLHAVKNQHYATIVQTGGVNLRPGIDRLVRDARAAGLPLAIATTTSERNVHELLNATWGPGSAAWFAVIGAGDVVPNKKPAPDIYLHVLRHLGLAPQQALALEDSAVGAHSALAAGLPVVVTRSRYTAHDTLPAGLLAELHQLDEAHPLAQLRRWHAQAAAAPRTQGLTAS
ncbi:haloacid dehalogenase superfamily protein, subfamily IA, variant 3 with third motif having DD or ED [Burkholderiales bacterium JOSHI_001]|nr:haloacid dehalogenase superfamily protein, subfamily IA, variant 3 with third motif having DD or ED [Burkholderiales bacterium JOSHI_001]